ncbi:MAG TPA: 5-deoxy-glucuronate isomerase [bacterium]|nr:5-deoxy-glucuronate isomerase [bacterium]HRV03840.1 5-deoxy-glucuronate isomerase [Candidatus Ratteibacteria bacterium]
MALRLNVLKKDGFQKKLISPENSDLKYLSFSYYFGLNKRTIEEYTANQEWLWVLLSGKMEIRTNSGISGMMQRKNVFEEKPASFYISPESYYTIEMGEETEAIAVSAPAESDFTSLFIRPDSIKKARAGKLNYQRSIFDIMTQEFPASKIIAGETIHDVGHWSCFPPHKHDCDNMPEESKHEELYFFKFEPEKTGFGMIRIYDETQDIAFPILTNDLITIPRGYHPVGVIPEHKLYYFWALAGEKRQFQRHTHPDYLKYE